MKTVSLLSLFLLATATFGQEAKRVPKGIREADKAEEKFEKSIPRHSSAFALSQMKSKGLLYSG